MGILICLLIIDIILSLSVGISDKKFSEGLTLFLFLLVFTIIIVIIVTTTTDPEKSTGEILKEESVALVPIDKTKNDLPIYIERIEDTYYCVKQVNDEFILIEMPAIHVIIKGAEQEGSTLTITTYKDKLGFFNMGFLRWKNYIITIPKECYLSKDFILSY